MIDLIGSNEMQHTFPPSFSTLEMTDLIGSNEMQHTFFFCQEKCNTLYPVNRQTSI